MNCKTFARLALAPLALGFALDAAAASWDEKFYNPMADADDVVLPMPCDGAMVFRKVLIPVAGPLDDYPINIGADSAEYGYVEQTRPAFIAGSFTSAKGDKSRYYLLAKYEMTQLQYRALSDETCPTPSNKQRLPVVSAGWTPCRPPTSTTAGCAPMLLTSCPAKTARRASCAYRPKSSGSLPHAEDCRSAPPNSATFVTQWPMA